MRPMRFRVWDKLTKKFSSKDGCNLHGEVFFLFGAGALKPNDDRSTFDYLNDVEFHQFTGCVDVDGNEIYEGDVIESIFLDETPCRHLIWFSDASFVAVQTCNSDWCNGKGKLSQQWLTGCEKRVIGNIYDNPELDVWNHDYL